MWWFIVTFVCGLTVGRKNWLPTTILLRTPWVVFPSLAMLVFILGGQLGANRSLLHLLPKLGLQSLVICTMAMAASAGLGGALQPWLLPRNLTVGDECAVSSSRDSGQTSRVKKLPGFIVLMVALGVIVGYLSDGSFRIPQLMQNAIFALMLLGIGIEIGLDPKFWKHIRQASWRMFIFPFISVAGSLIGGIAAAFLINGRLVDSLAAAAGCGWYSLAGVLVNQVSGPVAGTVAFLSNVIREVLCFLIIPLFIRRNWVASAMATGGATTMDTTLAFFSRSGFAQVGMVYAFVNGAVTSALVPIVIPFVLHFAT